MWVGGGCERRLQVRRGEGSSQQGTGRTHPPTLPAPTTRARPCPGGTPTHPTNPPPPTHLYSQAPTVEVPLSASSRRVASSGAVTRGATERTKRAMEGR